MIRFYRESMSRYELVKDADAWESCDQPAKMLPLLAQFPGSRRPRLLACAYVRHVPFGIDGKSIWGLVPGYRWFELPPSFRNLRMTQDRDLTIDGRALTCHSIIEMAERRADEMVADDSWNKAAFAASRAEWMAEADTFREELPCFVGSRLRYAAACQILHVTKNDRETDANRLLKYLLMWPDYITKHDSVEIHPDNGKSLCRMIRDLYGNPFRPVILDAEQIGDNARALARAIDADRDFDLMPVLGDVLEESGCEQVEVLRHCRGEHDHARGCWVIDQILGRDSLPQFDYDRVLTWLELLPDQWPVRPSWDVW